jgi:tetratricopeptide (TPR) repeat protein
MSMIDRHRAGMLAKAAGVYLASGWLAYEIISELIVVLGLPDAVGTVTLVLLLLGLPAVLATAFVQSAPRMQHVPDLREHDPTLHPGLGDVAQRTTTSPSRFASLLTWRRTLTAGVALFALLGLATTAFMTMRHLGVAGVGTLMAQGVIDAQDPIVMADFSSDRDAALAHAVAEALRIDLLQSSVIRIAEPAFVREALRRMERDPADGMTPEIARELAEREGLKAYIRGSIRSVGGGYQLSAELVGADGTVLVPARETASDSTKLIEAVDRLSNRLRERIGESLRTIRTTQSLSKVTTASLPALRSYSDALRVSYSTGDQLRMVELYEQAIALDSSFASAWLGKGIALTNLGFRLGERNEAFRRAYALRERMPEREKWLAVAAHAAYVTRDNRASIEAYRNLLAIEPHNNAAVNNLAVRLRNDRRFAEAEEVILNAGPDALKRSPYLYLNLATSQIDQGRFAEAERTVLDAQAAHPTHLNAISLAVNAELVRWRLDSADSIARSYITSSTNPLVMRYLLDLRASIAAQQGRLSAADELLGELERLAARYNVPEGEVMAVAWRGQLRVMHGSAPEPHVQAVQSVLRRVNVDALPPLSRPYLSLAYFYALAGRPDLAAAALADYRREVPLEDQVDDELIATEAAVLLYGGRPTEAIARLRSVMDRGPCLLCGMAELAHAYELSSQPDSALAVYERYLTTPFSGRASLDAQHRATTLFRAAELHERAGNRARAMERYAEFIELWKDADPSLQPRVQTARQRLQQLAGER